MMINTEVQTFVIYISHDIDLGRSRGLAMYRRLHKAICKVSVK